MTDVNPLCWGGVPWHDYDGDGRCMTCGHRTDNGTSQDPASGGAQHANPAPGIDPGAGCPECGGTGTVIKSDPPHEYANQYQEPCPLCRPDLGEGA